MEELVKYIVTNLVDHEEEVKIESTREGDSINILVTVAPDDVGKVIGKNGRIAQSIRAIVKSVSAKEHIRYNVKINK
ncbi:MAG: KH domain-containing protein [Clostridiales bacterium]|nr:KH domain-containing protein [Clostridiales bacterium]